jgi:hypothetical protein
MSETKRNWIRFVAKDSAWHRDYLNLRSALLGLFNTVSIGELENGFLVLCDPDGTEIGVIASGLEIYEALSLLDGENLFED